MKKSLAWFNFLLFAPQLIFASSEQVSSGENCGAKVQAIQSTRSRILDFDMNYISGAIEVTMAPIWSEEEARKVHALVHASGENGNARSTLEKVPSNEKFQAFNPVLHEFRDLLGEILTAPLEQHTKRVIADVYSRNAKVIRVGVFLTTEKGVHEEGHAHGVTSDKRLDYILYLTPIIGPGTEVARNLSVRKPANESGYFRVATGNTLILADTWHRTPKIIGKRLLVALIVALEHSSTTILERDDAL